MSTSVRAENRRKLPTGEISRFLAECLPYMLQQLEGICRFPMRELGRHDELALAHEDAVRQRFSQGESNLFGLSINPDSYRGIADCESDERLYEFFILNHPMMPSPLKNLMGAKWVSDALEAGLLDVNREGLFVCGFRVVPHGDLLILSDRYSTANDAVYLSNDSLFLSARTCELLEQQTQIERIVDLGTGTGILGCTAGRLFDKPVVGCDINPRALAFARANQEINRVAATWIEGDYASVSIAEHSLVVANPPFVFSPSEEHPATHSAGGALGLSLTHEVLARLNQELPQTAHFLLITQSPVLRGDREPILVSQLGQQFSRLDLTIETVGQFPPPAKYAEFYDRQNVESFEQILITGSRGEGVRMRLSDNRFAPNFCFG